jgi:hypothetical protein
VRDGQLGQSALFRRYINANFAAIQAALGFTDDELRQLARNGFTSAYLSEANICLSSTDTGRSPQCLIQSGSSIRCASQGARTTRRPFLAALLEKAVNKGSRPALETITALVMDKRADKMKSGVA